MIKVELGTRRGRRASCKNFYIHRKNCEQGFGSMHDEVLSLINFMESKGRKRDHDGFIAVNSVWKDVYPSIRTKIHRTQK